MTWLEMIAHYKGYQDLLQENERFRIPLRPLNQRDSLYRRALWGVGRRMARWGQALQERYPAPTSSPSWQVHQTG
ncbi:MAG: hypothetical protein ACUVTV_01635 [Anaerolineae bacterium]